MTTIAVVGANGRMGKSIIKCINQSDESTLGATLNKHDNLSLVLDKFDVLIDFTLPKATLNYLDICNQANKPVVIGTTGFSSDELCIIKKIAKNIPILHSPNMSIGVNLSLKLLDMTARAIGEEADIEIIEAHHRDKIDSPSGTALKMGEVVANALDRDLSKCAVYNRQRLDKPRDKKTIGFSSIRGGDVVGEHTVSFFTQGECIEITHKASSRMTFANGAVRAANWLKERPAGLYSMQDMLNLKN